MNDPLDDDREYWRCDHCGTRHDFDLDGDSADVPTGDVLCGRCADTLTYRCSVCGDPHPLSRLFSPRFEAGRPRACGTDELLCVACYARP